MSEAKKQYSDPLVRERLFPNAAEIFSFAPTSLSKALEDGIVVVDTNVLLIPYTTGRSSLEQIRLTYNRLVSENRLRIPGQVAREFADNRAEKLKTLYQQLSRKRDINFAQSEYPLLEGLPDYSEVASIETEITNALKKYRKAVSNLLDKVAAWNWDDPVSLIYRNIIKPEIIIEPRFEREDLLKELRYRQEHRIPPGFKDASNEYSGVGDLLIWKALLEIGKQTERDVIFVSGDEKTDWRYQSENRALYPRFELLDEFRVASGGKTLLIISFAELLQQFGVPAPVIEEVRKEEVIAALTAPVEEGLSIYQRAARAERAVLQWLVKQYPDSVIESSSNARFDFLVTSSSGLEGFNIKIVSGPEMLHRRFRDWTFQSSKMGIPISLVVVLERQFNIENIIRRISLSFVSKFENSKLIIGVVGEDEVFEELYQISGGRQI